jgi:hypothetical protein
MTVRMAGKIEQVEVITPVQRLRLAALVGGREGGDRSRDLFVGHVGAAGPT